MNHPDSERDPLERLAEEFTHRLRCGEQPSVEEYAASHPDLAEQIRATFPGLVMMEELASREFSARQTTAGGTTALATLQVERIGDFRIVRKVGRGGMGIVYEAMQESLGRRVALKVLPAPRHGGVSRLAQFEREAAAAARLHHTNIVPVFAVGSEEEVCFYAMQFIDGEPLDRILQQTDPGRLRESGYARWVARVGLQIAQGLEYAHTRGTLHRDIKPANLLIDDQQTVWITDFGVAQLAEAEDLTIPGDVVGTLRYMSPEQLNGQADARSDVYSLGLTLYEMLTLRPAFGESSRTRLLRQISEAEPASLPKSNPDVPLDLVTIVSKAMAREPERRYPSASELAEDLGRFLRGEPIRARRVTLAERAWRWCRRNRAIAALSAVAATAVIVALVAGWVGYLQTGRALRQTEQAVDRAESNLTLSLEALESVFNQTAGRDWLLVPADDPEIEPFSTNVSSEENAALLEGLLGFYERFAEKNEGNSRLLAETAQAYRRVGEIQTQLGQPDKADAALRRSMGLSQALTTIPAEQQRYAPDVAAVYIDLGLTPQYSERSRETRRECFERALAILSDDRSDAGCLQRIRALNSLGRTAPSSGRWFWNAAGMSSRRQQRPLTEAAKEEAERHHREALSIAEELAARDPENADYRFLLAQTHRYLGQRLLSLGRAEEAVLENDRAATILEELAAEFPGGAHYKAELAEAYAMFVAAAWPRSEAVAAKRRLEKARQLADELVAQHPRVPDYLALAARLYAREGAFAAWTGSQAEAIDAYRKAITSFEGLTNRYPGVLSFPYMVCVHRHVLGEYLRAIGQSEEARTEFEKSAAGLESLLQNQTDVPPSASNYRRRVYQSLAQTLDDLGDRQGAAAMRERIRGSAVSKAQTVE